MTSCKRGPNTKSAICDHEKQKHKKKRNETNQRETKGIKMNQQNETKRTEPTKRTKRNERMLRNRMRTRIGGDAQPAPLFAVFNSNK